MKSLKFTATVLSMAFLTSCSFIPEEKTVHVDYEQEDSRNLANRSATLNHMNLSITSYSLHTGEFLGVKPKGKGYFFVVDYSIHNYSEVTQEFDPKRLSLIVTSGDEYDLATNHSRSFEEYSEPIGPILPSEVISSTVVFELPSATEPDTLIVGGVTHDKDQVIDVPVPKDQ